MPKPQESLWWLQLPCYTSYFAGLLVGDILLMEIGLAPRNPRLLVSRK